MWKSYRTLHHETQNDLIHLLFIWYKLYIILCSWMVWFHTVGRFHTVHTVGWVRFMVLNATFNNISVWSWRSVLLVLETEVSRENLSVTNFIIYCCIKCTSQWTGSELTTLVVIGTDCTGSCKSNYHLITTTTVHTVEWFHTVYVLPYCYMVSYCIYAAILLNGFILCICCHAVTWFHTVYMLPYC